MKGKKLYIYEEEWAGHMCNFLVIVLEKLKGEWSCWRSCCVEHAWTMCIISLPSPKQCLRFTYV